MALELLVLLPPLFPISTHLTARIFLLPLRVRTGPFFAHRGAPACGPSRESSPADHDTQTPWRRSSNIAFLSPEFGTRSRLARATASPLFSSMLSSTFINSSFFAHYVSLPDALLAPLSTQARISLQCGPTTHPGSHLGSAFTTHTPKPDAHADTAPTGPASILVCRAPPCGITSPFCNTCPRS